MKLQQKWIRALRLSTGFLASISSISLLALAQEDEGKARSTSAALKKPELASEITANLQQEKTIEVCFVLDTTGSMGGLIEGAKQKIWEIANHMIEQEGSPKIKFSLVAYRDRGDEYVTQVTNLNEDLDVIHHQLMQFEAAGGGDTPESVNQALHEAVTQVEWTAGDEVTKIIFLVGDAPPQMNYEQDIPYPESCQLAQEQGITINTIQCGKINETVEPWQQIAKLGGGQYILLPQDGGVVTQSAPQDKEIAELTKKLNSSVIPYGDQERQKQAQWKVDNSNELLEKDATLNASRAEFMSNQEGGAKAFLGENDLVSEWEDKQITLSNLNREHLPEEYKKLSNEDLVKALDERIQSRATMKAEMDELLAERKTHLAQEMAKRTKSEKENAFDKRVQQVLEKQVK